MHIALDNSLTELGELELRSHSVIIDALLTKHVHREHLLVLNPKQVQALRGSIQFGPLNSRALDTILRKSQDYNASLRAAGSHILVMPLESGIELEVRGKAYAVGPRWLSPRLGQQPCLYVENGVNDGSFYRWLIGQAIGSVGGSAAHICIRPFHGGGQALGAAMETLVGPDLMGLCLCDRDKGCEIPPFVAASTGASVHEALVRMNVVSAQDYNGSTSPFFAFQPTYGWALENYVGPNLLDAYFSCRPEAREHRLGFTRAFPHFPQLNPHEQHAWMSVNFRSGTQSAEAVELGLRYRGVPLGAMGDRLPALGQLTFPGDVLTWVIEMANAGRYKKEVIAALKRDLGNDIYRNAVFSLTASARDLLAADVNMAFA